MSGLLEQLDRLLRAVGGREPGVVLPVGSRPAVAEDLPVALLVLAEEVGREVVAAAVPLAQLTVDPDPHGGHGRTLRSTPSRTSVRLLRDGRVGPARVEVGERLAQL